tara:strand:+ start:4271 stop:5191 length:921 start_codon:yes stop_codon:yes gene_type:complete
MAVGNTITDSLADSIPTMIAAARIVREFAGVMPNLVDRQRLDENTGTVWNEVSMAKLSAQAVTESTELDNPQQMSDTLLSITPTVIGVHTVITDRVAMRISSNAYAQTGSLAQNAIERKKDADGLTAIDGATTQLGSAGAGLDTSDITSAAYRITSNTTEPAPATAPIHAVFHGFQLADIDNQLTTPGISVVSSGTITEAQAGAPLTVGIAAEAFQNRYRGTIAGARLYEDGNLTIDGSDDAKGGVFSQMALILVEGRSPYVETKRMPELGGGATALFHYDEYAYGERSSGNWLYEVISDALAPSG